ncbi:GNAT family N-acetyltransferase [Dietzia timorensis]|uniref:Putative N-acetyltransferase n=1 Tax=Dietzia timorensis TaxID=499555 RepID=A0A173LPA1_9ACTN|nr:GNAT family N-acetyltransferase [Dietzia timorensis]ANI92542.1 putative N-acetyltransferase [Dietzia timorensis]
MDRTFSNDGGQRLSPNSAAPILAAEEFDASDLSSLASLTFPLACPPELTKADMAAFIEENLTPSAFRRYIAEPENVVLLARDAVGDPLAYTLGIPGRGDDDDAAALITAERPMYLSKVYAAPRAHGTGLSTALMDAHAVVARERGFDSLWLGTNVDNGRARRFYEKIGFVDRGRRTFLVGGQNCHDVVYELPL